MKMMFILLALVTTLSAEWKMIDTKMGAFMYNSSTGEAWRFDEKHIFYQSKFRGKEIDGNGMGWYKTPKDAKASKTKPDPSWKKK